jgi:hypothetical protein
MAAGGAWVDTTDVAFGLGKESARGDSLIAHLPCAAFFTARDSSRVLVS